jgi:hypothetical protein
MSYRAIEAGGFGNMPRSVRHQGPPRESEGKRPACEPATPRTLRGPRPETDWNVDWRRGGVGRVAPRLDFWLKNVTKSVKMSFFEVMSEVQKDSEDVSAGIGILKKIKLLNKFSCNLRSKSARSTLTSPGPIRVNVKKLCLLSYKNLAFSSIFL